MPPEQLQNFHNLDTPEVLLLPALHKNIRSMQQRADSAGLDLWPHIKTHKSPEIARLQLQAGAKGLTAAKVQEALCFIRAGLGPVLLAYPLVDAGKAETLLTAGRETGIALRCIADSMRGVAILQQAAARLDMALEVCIKVDVGLRRCGVAADAPELVHLARAIEDAGNLQLRGLLSHAGQAYAAADADAVAQVAEEERRLLLAAKKRLQQLGLAQNCRLSVGSTPTVLGATSFAGLDELRPGNYVFLDRTPLRLGLAQKQDIALLVLASVVSKNTDNIVIDAGAKTLGLDKAPHGLDPAGAGGADFGFGLLRWPESSPDALAPRLITRLSEEHGLISRAQAPGFEPPLGSKVLVTPNHSCVVANLALRLTQLSADAPPRFLEVQARGQVR